MRETASAAPFAYFCVDSCHHPLGQVNEGNLLLTEGVADRRCGDATVDGLTLASLLRLPSYLLYEVSGCKVGNLIPILIINCTLDHISERARQGCRAHGS